MAKSFHDKYMIIVHFQACYKIHDEKRFSHRKDESAKRNT